jgi:predicted RNA-binding Zn-ribbon protein involved in translation (DUF1610 family)
MCPSAKCKSASFAQESTLRLYPNVAHRVTCRKQKVAQEGILRVVSPCAAWGYVPQKTHSPTERGRFSCATLLERKPVAGFRCPECGETRYLYRGQVTHVYCDDDDPGARDRTAHGNVSSIQQTMGFNAFHRVPTGIATESTALEST